MENAELNQPATLQCPKRVLQPTNFVESIKFRFKLMYERRNMVKMPTISTASFPLFLRSLLACLLYIIIFRKAAWYRLSGELVQQRGEATLPVLRAAVLESAACSENFSAEFMRNQLSLLGTRSSAEYYADEWNVIEFTSLAEHWDCFLRYKATRWKDSPALAHATGTSLGVFYIWLIDHKHASIVCVDCFVTGFNYVITSMAYHKKFLLLNCDYQGFEWANALSPNPSVGIWWEIELMAIPSLWYASMALAMLYLVLTSMEPLTPKSAGPVWYVLAGLLSVIGISHGSYILLTTKREVEAIGKSWKTRVDGWVFEQQYAIPASLRSRDQGLDIEAM